MRQVAAPSLIVIGIAVAGLGYNELRGEPLLQPWVGPALLGVGIVIVVTALVWIVWLARPGTS